MNTLLLILSGLSTISAGGELLVSRANGDAQYACAQDVTWTTDAFLSKSLGFSVWNYDRAELFIDHVNSIAYAGHRAWRMPMYDPDGSELSYMYTSIFKWPTTATAPFINVRAPVDSNEAFDGYWSSTCKDRDGVNLCKEFHFNNGAEHWDGRNQPDVVWPVTDGDPLLAEGDDTCNVTSQP